MAQNAEIGSLRVTLALNAGEFRRGSRQVQQEMSALGRSIEEISNRINRSSILINTGIMAAQRFASVSQSILNVASTFEKGMSNVATLVDTTTENLGAMSDAVLAIGRRTPVALTELTTALYDIRSAGIPAADALAVLENSAKLAVAGLGTTKESVDLVTSSINAFGLQGEDAEKVYDQIFKTVKAGKTTISELAQGFGAVAGTVANAGISLDDYLASVAALTTTGLPAAQAHTQIRAAIAGLLRETKETKALFDAMNVKTFKELVTQSGSVVVAFERIAKATQGNDAMLIKLLGSVEAYNALIGLAGKQNTAWNSTLQSMRQGADAVGEAFDKQNETVAAATQRLQNNIQTLGIAMGNALAPAIKSLADFVGELAEGFKSLSPEMQEIIARIAAFAAVTGPAIIAVGFFANALASLIPVFTAIGVVVAGLLAGTGPIGMFVIVASAAVTAWNIFKEEIIAIWEAVAGLITRKIDEIVAQVTQFANAIATAFGQLANFEFSEAFKTLEQAVTSTSAWTTEIEKLGATAAKVATVDMPAAAASFNDGYVVPVSEGVDKLAKLVEEQHNVALRNAAQIIKEMQTPMEELIAKQDKIRHAFDMGALSAEQYGRAMAQATAFSSKNMDALASSVSSNLETIFGDTKAVAIATALINTYQGITKALATYPPPIAQAMAAVQAAAGFAQVASIRSQTSKGGGSGGGGGDGGAAVAAPVAAAPSQSLFVQGIDPTQMFSGSAMRDLAEQLLQFQRDGGTVILA